METHAELTIAPSINEAGLPPELQVKTADTAHFIKDNFGIDDARELVRVSAQRGFEGKRHFVVFAAAMTLEAQNALLKLFEDPPEQTYFHLVVPSASILLPTLRSRLIDSGRADNATTDETAATFQQLSYKERLEMIADLAKKDPTALERLAIAIGSLPLNDEAKRSLLLVTKYVKNRGASRKMLLEELALSL